MLIVSLHFSSLCARREGDWGEGITMHASISLHKLILPCTVYFALPLPPTLPAVFCWQPPLHRQFR